MALTLYTKSSDEKLIERVKLKVLREKSSVSEVTLKLLRLWVDNKIKIK